MVISDEVVLLHTTPVVQRYCICNLVVILHFHKHTNLLNPPPNNDNTPLCMNSFIAFVIVNIFII